MSYEDTVHVSFSHKCSQFSQYNALNVEVAITFPNIFFFPLLIRLCFLPWSFSFQYGWLPKVFPRCLCSSGYSFHASVSLFSLFFLYMCTWIFNHSRVFNHFQTGPIVQKCARFTCVVDYLKYSWDAFAPQDPWFTCRFPFSPWFLCLCTHGSLIILGFLIILK